MTQPEPVRRLLEERGCAEDVVAGGLEGLVAEWERTVRQVDDGYPLGLDDYLNDLDGRQLIEDALDVASESQRLALEERVHRADERMRALVKMLGECLWGRRVAEVEGWTPDEQWWYFAVPASPGPLLREDLEERG